MARAGVIQAVVCERTRVEQRLQAVLRVSSIAFISGTCPLEGGQAFKGTEGRSIMTPILHFPKPVASLELSILKHFSWILYGVRVWSELRKGCGENRGA